MDKNGAPFMKILALIDDLFVTIKFKTALLLLGSLAAFVASVALFVISLIKFRRKQEPTLDAATATETKTTPTAKEAEATLESLRTQLTEATKAIRDLSTQVDSMSKSMEQARTDRTEKVKQRAQAIQQRRIEQEREEAEKQRHRRLSVLKRAQNELSGTQDSEVVQVAIATNDLLSRLIEQPHANGELTETFKDYVAVANKATELAGRLAQLDGSQPDYSQDILDELEGEMKSFLATVQELEKNHRVACFTDLLEEVGRYSSLKDSAVELKRLLKLEEVKIQAGSMLQDLKEFEVVSAEGLGDRAIVSEVLANGYRFVETGTMLKRPRVRVHFEV
jgi:chromosome segregation ATPase